MRNELHLHVDGPDECTIRAVAAELIRRNFPTDVWKVLKFLPGPQRADLPEIYTDHTAGSLDMERFGAFSQTRLAKQNIQQVMDIISLKLKGTTGNVVELEDVIARCDIGGKWQEKNIRSLDDPNRNSKQLVEIHHEVSFPGLNMHHGEQRLHELLHMTNSINIRVGGWFLFADKGELFFTTNKFIIGGNGIAAAKSDHAQILDHLSSSHEKHTFSTMVEQVLAIKRAN